MKTKLEVECFEDRILCSTSPAYPHPGPFTSHGGPVISHVRVEMIFYGDFWSTAKGQAQATMLQQATNNLIGGSYMDGLAQFGVGRGNVDQVDFVPGSLTKIGGQGLKIIRQEVHNSHLSGPEDDKLFLIIAAPGIKTAGDWHSWGHVDQQVTYFGEINYNAHCTNAFQNQVWGNTHEVVESVTDPDTYQGWQFYKMPGEISEICDVAEGKKVVGATYDGYKVSPYWRALGNPPPVNTTHATAALAETGASLVHDVGWSVDSVFGRFPFSETDKRGLYGR